MNSYLRTACLVMFAAGGVGLAVALVFFQDHHGDLFETLREQIRPPQADLDSREDEKNTTLESQAQQYIPERSSNKDRDRWATSRTIAVKTFSAPGEVGGPVFAQPADRVADNGNPRIVRSESVQPMDTTVDKLIGVVKDLALGNQRLAVRTAALESNDELSHSSAGDDQGLQNDERIAAKTSADTKVADEELVKKVPGEGDDLLTIQLHNTDINKVLALLSEQGNLNILASKSVQGNVSARLNGVDVETALTSILKSAGYTWRQDDHCIYVGTPADFQAIDQSLDRIITRVYRTNYVSAREVEKLVTPLLTEKLGTIGVSTPSQVGIEANGSEAGGDNFAGSEVVVVRDYESVIEMVDGVIGEIDQRPTQVALEAMIISVKLSDKNKMGVDFEFLLNEPTTTLALGSPLANLGALGFTEGGFKFGFIDSSLKAFVDALETVGDTNVIASPRLMCLNKQRAEILIGSQLGYVSTTQTETSTTQNVEFLEIGTQLRIRPFISSDGMIRLEVHPELSTGLVKIDNGLTLPEKEVTQVTTNVMVKDGSTLLIGGLIREELAETTNQTPFFGNLPWIGPAFRRSIQTTERQEILVLITPHIVYEPESAYRADKASREFHHRQMVYADKMSPIGKRYLARKYFYAAQKQWHGGDQGQALKMIDLSIHFDPMSRKAIELRSDIAAGNHAGDHTDVHPPRVGPGLHPLDSDVIAPWVLEDLHGKSPLRKQHPVHPGPRTPRRSFSPPTSWK